MSTLPPKAAIPCEIDGRFASEYVIAVNCDGNRIAAGKRQFKRLVEMGVDPIVFLTFRAGARSHASPILLIRPLRSVSPDWYFFGVNPKCEPAFFDDLNRAGSSTAAA